MIYIFYNIFPDRRLLSPNDLTKEYVESLTTDTSVKGP